MDRFLEYAVRHPLLVGGTVLLALVAAAYEFSRARSGGQSVGPTDAVRLLNQGALLVDVRSQAEFDSGHIIDARHVPQEDLAQAGEIAQALSRQGRGRFLRVRCSLGSGCAHVDRAGLYQGREPAGRPAGMAGREPAVDQEGSGSQGQVQETAP